MLQHVSNPDLTTIKEDWPGTPMENGRFVNHEYPFWPHFSDLMKWLRAPKPQKEAKKKDTYTPDTDHSGEFLRSQEDCIVWLGHASFFIRLAGVSFLTDPVFYDIPFVKRISSPPVKLDKLKNIDYLLISHDHRDHCQKKSLRQLAENNPGMQVLSGLNMHMLLNLYTDGLPVQEAGWYQQYELNHTGVRVYFLPSRHWSRRHLTDTNKRLWGAFVFQTDDKTIYFSGDTGYGSHLEEVATLFPEGIDMCICGIGAFRPEWIMAPNHMSPHDAAKAANDMGARHFIPMHHGTFDLSDEPAGEPIEILRRLKKNGLLKAHLLEPVLGRPVPDFF